MGQRLAITRFAFNGLSKDLKFTYDDETDQHILALIQGGYLSDITPKKPETRVIMMPSIDSSEEFGVIGGQGEDQPLDGGGDGPPLVHAAGEEDVQGNQGDGPEVAKGRKRRTDVSTDGRIGF